MSNFHRWYRSSFSSNIDFSCNSEHNGQLQKQKLDIQSDYNINIIKPRDSEDTFSLKPVLIAASEELKRETPQEGINNTKIEANRFITPERRFSQVNYCLSSLRFNFYIEPRVYKRRRRTWIIPQNGKRCAEWRNEEHRDATTEKCTEF